MIKDGGKSFEYFTYCWLAALVGLVFNLNSGCLQVEMLLGVSDTT